MTARRLRTPATDGGMLVEPPPGVAGSLAADNAARLAAWDYDFQGRRAHLLRVQVRREVAGVAGEFLHVHGLDGPRSVPQSASPTSPTGGGSAVSSIPLIVTGHQPELFHPGVWVKNFAAAAIAGSCQGQALNLIVDNDIPKSASIRVPALDGDALRTVRVDFDRWQGEVPYEDWHIRDEPAFSTFADRVRKVLAGAVSDPVLDDFWPRVVGHRARVDSLGLLFSLARSELEGSWGVSNLEIPMSTVCQTDGFRWFAAHLLAQLPRFQKVHNTCLAEYRAAHRIRSRYHPVPTLVRQDEWLEAPFWVWREQQPRRRALFARQRGRVLELRIAGEEQVLAALPLTPEGEACCAVERLRELTGQGIRLRTRALTTTMFSRFLLGDLFIHGIGGARYDELGDEIARRYFGFDPPGFLTISLTLWLGLPSQPATPAELAAVGRWLRDLKFNPERYLGEPNSEQARIVIHAKRAAIEGPVTSHRERIARGKAIRSYNEALQPGVEALRTELAARQARLRAGLRWNRIGRNREFASVLHSAHGLGRVLRGVANGTQIRWDQPAGNA
jgi:hypothetical protein